MYRYEYMTHQVEYKSIYEELKDAIAAAILDLKNESASFGRIVSISDNVTVVSKHAFVHVANMIMNDDEE